ncbi:EAL domain-containing protein (putative c-di-GMP-specific phosphodiesterase class I) [Paraburkholderia sp. BL6665CI2N2]|uniref:EAL domain-containing protein n=1 Tax=Paraburkholderia sp. BL6665CI2N2 TaxID=1938806 RepID=UPI0010EF1F58|nr:EAL domain-containing protein [Paraburkholderia sp. BL6665CI2N2]TDY17139.1 EAL domain-containing protein (putative c-di-GMP-specific phosphodiesterase class I) [Paraburkholderia sp. BL6665CI2N2]
MRFLQRYTGRIRWPRPVFDEHLDAVVTLAVASSVAGLLTASLTASRDAVVLVIALSACCAVVYVGYRVRPKARLQRAARIGLRRGEFHVVYQPIVDTRTRHCVGVEALLRWGHPKFGAGGPGLFIGELEGTRLLRALTCFVLREANNACTQLPFPQHWHISVNICARHLLEDRFVEDICESAGPTLERLVLELTERSCVERTPRVVTALDHLKQRDVRLSLDDFGTGFSNLDLLADFQFDHVKVDRRFLAMSSEARIQFLKSMAALVHALGAKVVVEGVESAAEHDVVKRSGIDLAQGYWYGKPMAVDQLRAFASASINTLQDGTGTELTA